MFYLISAKFQLIKNIFYSLGNDNNTEYSEYINQALNQMVPFQTTSECAYHHKLSEEIITQQKTPLTRKYPKQS